MSIKMLFRIYFKDLGSAKAIAGTDLMVALHRNGTRSGLQRRFSRRDENLAAMAGLLHQRMSFADIIKAKHGMGECPHPA